MITVNSDREITAYKALGKAVLMDAIKALDNQPRDKSERVLYNELVAWFNSDSDKYLFAFIPLCNWLGLSASAVRRTLKLKGKVMK